jgi:hypothetical protein
MEDPRNDKANVAKLPNCRFQGFVHCLAIGYHIPNFARPRNVLMLREGHGECLKIEMPPEDYFCLC